MELDAILECIVVEQEALEELSFKLEEQRLLLLAGRHRYLGRATAEINRAAAELAEVGRRRATLLGDLARALGLPPDSSLRSVADALGDDGARDRMHAVRAAMRAAMAQVQETVEQNRQLLASGLAATVDALALLGATPSYDASGSTAQAGDRAVLIDARA